MSTERQDKAIMLIKFYLNGPPQCFKSIQMQPNLVSFQKKERDLGLHDTSKLCKHIFALFLQDKSKINILFHLVYFDINLQQYWPSAIIC